MNLTSSRRTGTAILAVVLLVLACAPAAPAPAGTSGSAAPAGPGSGAAQPAGAAGGAGQADSLQRLVDAARREGALTLTWTENVGSREGIRRWIDGFNQAYGLNLNVQYTPGPSMPELANKISQEAQAGRAASSDVLAVADDQLVPLIRADVLEPVDWVSWAPNIRDPAVLAPDGVAVQIGSRVSGITYNTDKVRADEVPTSLQDLLKPQYKGRVASTIYAASFDVLASPELWGEARTTEYVTRLADQLGGLMRCGEMQRIASGEFDLLAIDCGSFVARRLQPIGAPIGHVIPSDAALLNYWYVAVPRNAAHPAAAKLWVNYLLSREAQDILYEGVFIDQHRLPGSKAAAEIEALQARGVKFTEINVDFYRRNDEQDLNRLSAEFQRILQKK
ncbi:MAG TPA: ABC transporter substrate-binding protein [Chloroflexota bacterium]|jgi:iron(III) transport system substrate-binding protein